MGVMIGDTPEAIAGREAKRTGLRQMVTIGSNLVRQRDSFMGELTKRERSLRCMIETSCQCRPESV
jgi:hypothetical protein